MSTVSPLNVPIEEVVYYVRRESPAVGAVFVSLNGDRCLILMAGSPEPSSPTTKPC